MSFNNLHPVTEKVERGNSDTGSGQCMGRLDTLPVEILGYVVDFLDLRSMKRLLMTYPESRDRILGCMRRFPRPQSSEEMVEFFRTFHPLPRPLPLPGYFGAINWSYLRELRVNVRDLELVSKCIQGDLSVSISGESARDSNWRKEVKKKIRGLLSFFRDRVGISSNDESSELGVSSHLTSISIFRSAIGDLEIRYKGEILFVRLRFREKFMKTLYPQVLDLIGKLSFSDLSIDLASYHSRQDLSKVLATKDIETFTIDNDHQVSILVELLEHQKREGLPYSIHTLMITSSFGSKALLKWKGHLMWEQHLLIPNVHTVLKVDLRAYEWEKFILLFPDLQTIEHCSSVDIHEELCVKYPKLRITRIERRIV